MRTIDKQPTLEAKRDLIREFFIVGRLDRQQACQELLKLGFHVDTVSTFLGRWAKERLD